MTGERGLQGALTTRAQLASAALALLLVAVLGGLLAQRLGALDSSTGAGQALAGTPAQAAPPFTKGVLPEGLLGPATAAIGAAEPAYWAHSSGARASARNRRQHFRIQFAPNSVSVHAARGTLTMRASAAGFGSLLSALPASAPRAMSNRVSYRYAALEEWYLNGPFGLEQGFTVASAPAHSPGQGLYTVELALGGTVSPSLVDGGHALTLRSPSGAAMRYGGLTATDATGRQLPAWLTLADGTLALHVKTQGARFPVSIDPILTEEGLAIELGQAAGEVKGEKSEFGESVALSSDGTTALIGAPDGKEHTGAAWVFHREGAKWSQQGPALTSGASKEENGCEEKSEEGEEGEEKEEKEALSCAFGRSVALSGEGNAALIGAPRAGSEPGVAWVFNREGETWTKEAEPLKGPAANNQQNFGFSVALSLDGDHALVGAPLEGAGHGAAYLFERAKPGLPWSKEGSPLIPSGEEATGKFGFSAALSADGSEAVVGAPLDKLHKGTVYIFEYHKNEGKWDQVAGPLTGEEELGEGRFGEDVAMSGNGSTVLVGGPRDNEKFGAVWTFIRPGANWIPFGIKLVGPGTEAKEEFGSGIALSGDGSHALVGAPRGNAEKGLESPGRAAGVVRLYEASKSEWVELSPTLNATLVEKGRGQFGRSVAMTENAQTLLVGAPHETARAGAVWLFGSRPQITQVESDSAKGGKAKGRLAGGTKVRIVGRNLESVVAVWFGGPPNKAKILGPAGPGTEGLETLVVESPPGQKGDADCTPEGKAVGCVNITVETADWLSAENSSDHFMYLAEGEEEEEEHERREHEHHGNDKNEKTVPFSQLGLGGSNGTLGGSNTKPPTPCSVALKASKVSVDSKARAHVSLAGHGTGKCGGKLTLQVKTGSGHHTHIKTIAAGPYVAYAGKASTVILKLNSLGRSMLHHDHGHLKARLVILKSYPTPAKSLLAAVSVLRELVHKH